MISHPLIPHRIDTDIFRLLSCVRCHAPSQNTTPVRQPIFHTTSLPE